MITELQAETASLKIKLPESVAQAFFDLGDAQRGRPEIAMLNFQEFYSGVAAPVFEHCGDLTWRVSHWAKHGDMDFETLLKVDKCLNWMKGNFDDEVNLNIKNNSTARRIPEDEYRTKFDTLRLVYAREHSKLAVYNRIQWLCREAAVALGKWELVKCTNHLRSLQQAGRNKDEFVRQAYAYELDPQGQPIPFWSLT